MALSKKQLEKFRERLLSWRRELEEEMNQVIHGMHEETQESFPDPTDQATMETDRDFDLRLRERERMLIRKIDQALNRIENGTYGICESCGGEIGYKRLQARPVTTLCIDCKTEQEHEERTLVE